MNRTAICVFLCLALTSAQARGQADGIAQLQTESVITIVEGFVASPGNNDWVIAEFQDAFGVVGYSDAFVDTQTGYLLAVNNLNFQFADAQSLSMNLFSPGQSEPFAAIVVIEQEGVIQS